MGYAPHMAWMALFLKTPEERLDRMQALTDHLRSLTYLCPHSLYPEEFYRCLIRGGVPSYEQRENARLKVSKLTVPARSLYGELGVCSVDSSNPGESDWPLANELCKDVLSRGLCDSVTLVRGYSRKGLFGTRYSRAVLASPDAARLAILHWFGLLLEDRLDLIIHHLDFSAAPELFVRSLWRRLVRECREDARFSIVVKPAP